MKLKKQDLLRAEKLVNCVTNCLWNIDTNEDKIIMLSQTINVRDCLFYLPVFILLNITSGRNSRKESPHSQVLSLNRQAKSYLT